MSNQDFILADEVESTPAKPARKRAPKLPTPADMETPFIEVAPREYNLETIQEFLDLVFHAGMTDQGETMVWMVDKHRKPVYPISEDEMLDYLGKTKQGKALYYGTASVRRDNTGKLYNRQALFERLHVIVLDDIGTKGKASDLPEGLEPTYIIESSKGNFQYGYVLEEPIDNLDSAKALVSIMYESGIADAGGKMPNKLVRLPEGINGKKGNKERTYFVSNLVTMDGPLWTPQKLLDTLDAGVDWAEVEENAEEATKRRNRMKAGATPWAPYRPLMASMTGIIDPVAEWLVENDKVVSENGDWLVIQCPWASSHTSGGDTAGYKPIGVGEDPSKRGFHCFHDSCESMHTEEFLQYVAALGGPTAAAKDQAADMVSSYVYDMVNDCAWKIKDTQDPRQISMSGLRNAHPRKTLVATPDGKLRPTAEYNMWLTSESRVTVMGTIFDPSNPARLVERDDDLFVNQFAPPSWGLGPYEEKHVEKFKQFIDYLIPAKAEREYYLDWLAAKVQDMGFRGAAIVMVAQVQGVGRSTLCDMIATMLGSVNVRNEPFEKIVGEQQYNDWLEAPFVVTDETLNTGGLNSYKTYEKLKELIDPRPRLMSINPKYGKQRRTMVHSSFMFLSNHSNALSITEDDRRFYVISNPHKPAPAKFFTELNDWVNEMEGGKPAWVTHVYRWLMERKIDMEILLAPPEATAAKKAMIEESRADLDLLGTEIFAKWPCEYISFGQFTHAVEHFADRVGLYDIQNYKAQLKRIFGSGTYALSQNSVFKLDGKNTRFKVIIAKANDDTTPKGELLTADDKAHIRAHLIAENIKESMENIAGALDVVGL